MAKAKCKTCRGYGLWAVGDLSPMGPIDFEDGCPVKICPECGAGERTGQPKKMDFDIVAVITGERGKGMSVSSQYFVDRFNKEFRKRRTRKKVKK